MASPKDFEKVAAKIQARAWEDKKFKQKLLAHPEKVAEEYGFHFPAETKLIVLENTKKKFHFVLEEKPEVLSDDFLKNVTAAGDCGCS